MDQTIRELLNGNSGDHIFPFFWQHGEDEETLRKMMKVIHESGCKSVCIESRPHPDFCGEKWWIDMDIIMDEARNRDMKVWVLDDSHFPTGFANGKVKNAPLELHRQSVVSSHKKYSGKERDLKIDLTKLFPPKLSAENFVAVSATKFMAKGAPVFNDDRILSVTVVDEQGELYDIPLSNTGIVNWHKPEGTYEIYVTGLSRNYGIHREYINMMNKDSVKILIDEVYEKHWDHYKDDFGKTLVGFFSDEPELGNGFYMTGSNLLGTGIDLPYSDELEEELKKSLGGSWKNDLIYLWNNEHPEKAAKVRLAFMDGVTKLVRQDFSYQIGEWCREHGVKYIGHVIEDNNSHSRTAVSLGHYFRGLNGQDMSGIDDIGGQVYPQGEDKKIRTLMGNRDGEFFHFALGNLAASAAAIEPLKKGDAMCEIFGNYGWSEGVRLEKYLADHFMVRGVNHFVPHAFTGKQFPDPDCPPHFYAQGHNPQYRHFSKIVEYMNRVCTLISGGHRESHVAVLYNGELEWMGKSMFIQKPLRKLYEAQILADTIPLDALIEKEHYQTSFEDGLKVNNQEYQVLIVPEAQFITKEMNEVLSQLSIPILFVNSLPEVIDGEINDSFNAVSLEDLTQEVKKYVSPCLNLEPADKNVRILEYVKDHKLYYLFNEAADKYEGKISLDPDKKYYEYDAWDNRVYEIKDDLITLYPNKGVIIVEDEAEEGLLSQKVKISGERHELKEFRRSVVENIDYPSFGSESIVTLPDDYAKTDPKFSGIIRYETYFKAEKGRKVTLVISDAYEGVEVFVNGVSLGIQVVKEFIYDLSDQLKDGDNQLVIEVATTLERKAKAMNKFDIVRIVQGQGGKAKDPSGLNGEVYLYY
ncbi:MAG: hypothetical protein IJI46_07135 [Erysipelotrichaceae bacterium]|nr:hypothetical protein [Erysipelotrichaceae bacterium]